MQRKKRNLIYILFVFIYSLCILPLIFYLYINMSFFGANIQAGNLTYRIGVSAIFVENGKTFINLNVSGNYSHNNFRRDADSVPLLDMYIMGSTGLYYPEQSMNESGKIVFVFNTTEIPDIIFVYPTGKYNDFQSHVPIDARTKRPIPFFVSPDEAIDLNNLVDQKKINVSVVGVSMERISIIIENISETSLNTRVGIGTWFKSNSGSIQNMLLINDYAFKAEKGKRYTLHLPVVCLNKSLNAPGGDSVFSLEQFDDSEKITYILKELNTLNLNQSELQVTVWTIIENDYLKDKLQGKLNSDLWPHLERFFH